MLWIESVHTLKRVRNSMAVTGSLTSPFGYLYGNKPKIIGLLSDFGRIAYITKIEKIKKHMTEKTHMTIMVGYTDNHTRDTHKMYNTKTKIVIMKSDVKWARWKMTDPEETMKMFCDLYEEDFVPGIE